MWMKSEKLRWLSGDLDIMKKYSNKKRQAVENCKKIEIEISSRSNEVNCCDEIECGRD